MTHAALLSAALLWTAADDHGTIEAVAPAEMTVYLADLGTRSVVEGPDGAPALRVEVPRRGEKPWSVVMHSATNTRPIRKGDLLVTAVRVRVVGPSGTTGLVGVYAESAVKDKFGSVGGQILPTTEVQTFRRSVESPGDYDAGEFRVAVHLAGQAQVVELYGVTLEAYLAGTPPAELKLDRITWDGRSADAPWRGEAATRIDRIRKADLAVRVTDADGVPVEGAEVTVRQQRHAWRFGTFVGATLLADDEDGRRYREVVRSRYNFLTLPAYLAEWGWLSDRNRTRYFRMADWARTNGIPARGHLLVYPGWAASPDEWFTLPKPELRRRLEAHIPRASRAFAQRGVTEWDVTNELRYNAEFMDEIGGVQVAADWFRQARKHLPDGMLYLNETMILPNGGQTETEQQTFERHLRTLLDAGAPIDGIGLQGHFRSEMTAPTRLLEILDRFAAFGKPIMVTEFDMDNDDKQAQADYLRDFYTAMFSHPGVAGVVMWQFWEGDMWQPRGHHFTKDWQETPLSRAFRDLVHDQWRTDAAGATDASGRFAVRAFQGVQSVTVRHGDYQWTRDLPLPPAGAAVEIAVP